MVENLLDTEGAWRRRSEELVLGDYAVEPRHAVPPQQHGALAVLISSDLGIGRNGQGRIGFRPFAVCRAPDPDEVEPVAVVEREPTTGERCV